jgi:ubiquinone/menaquinone biosynthesis C-methylase UbiE
MDKLTNIDDIAIPTHDELARQGLISRLRKYVMKDISAKMSAAYEAKVKPDFISAHGREPLSGEEVDASISDNLTYKMWSSIRYNAQEMVWESVREEVERHLPEMISVAQDAALERGHGGSLVLDKSIDIPNYVSGLDVHLMPGCWQAEHIDADVAQGAIYANGGMVFRGSLMPSKTKSGVGASVSKWLSIRNPDFYPKKILETGCTIGTNLFPYHGTYPNAELYGVDVAAPCLRYANARAVSKNLKAHFHQQNAETLNFPDHSFDLVVSSFFFHELPIRVTEKVLSECYRVLAPGGMMVHMELPPASAVDPYYNFYLDWDNEHNNEPNYRRFRAQNHDKLMISAGFETQDCFSVSIPDIGGVTAQEFKGVALGQVEPPQHGNYTSWCLFGAQKNI